VILQEMTLQEAKSIARHLGLTLRQVRSGKYRVNFRDGDETTAHYTDNLEDLPESLGAIHTSRQSCSKARKARIFALVWEASGIPVEARAAEFFARASDKCHRRPATAAVMTRRQH
jgi:hypothetical protein